MTCAPTIQAAFLPRLSWLLLVRMIKRPLLLLALGLGLTVGALALAAPVTATTPTEVGAGSGFKDGIYVFGEVPETGQFGSTYMVFSVRSRVITGAFYQPSSSFDCFHGNVVDRRLALTILDTYGQTSYPYALPLEVRDSQIAASGGAVGALVPSGFHQLSGPSELDYSILATCQASQGL